jgi:hypothetical protein
MTLAKTRLEKGIYFSWSVKCQVNRFFWDIPRVIFTIAEIKRKGKSFKKLFVGRLVD